MTQKAINYAIVLYQLGITENAVEEIRAQLEEAPELVAALSSPVVSHADKRRIADRVWSGSGAHIAGFMKTLCDNDGFGMIGDIFDEYESYAREQENVLTATLYYVTPPNEAQKKGIEDFLIREYGKTSVQLSMVEKKELIGGFVIQTGDREYDRSVLGRYKSLKQKLVMR